MHKVSASGQQYRERSGSHATKGSATGVDKLGLGAGVDETLTPLQQREALTGARRMLLAQIEDTKRTRKDATTDKQRQIINQKMAEMGMRYQEICQKLRAIKEKLPHHANDKAPLGDHIIAVCRERCTKPEWEIVMKEARRRYDAGLQHKEYI